MIEIRMATPADAAEILDIYSYYINETAITFDYDVPSVKEFAGRIAAVLERYPYLAAVEDGRIMGYAYASSFKNRSAYDWAVETTVYVRHGEGGRGVGKALYIRLEELLALQNVTNLNACITFPNPDSEAFHSHMGYHRAAHFTNCGYKLGRWWDMIWMEKHIGEHKIPPEPFIPLNSLDR